MNTLSPRIRQSLFNKVIMEYLTLFQTKSEVTFKYSQDISLHISMWRIVRWDVPTIWLASKSQILIRFAVQATLKELSCWFFLSNEIFYYSTILYYQNG